MTNSRPNGATPGGHRPGITLLLVTSVLVLVVVAAFVVWAQRKHPGEQATATSSQTWTGSTPADSSAEQPSREGLEAIKDSRIVFGHQSIGMNILQAMPTVFSSFGLQAPEVASVDWPQARDTADPVFAEIWVGTNGDALGKISDFASQINSASHPYDIAFMKIGPVDITANTDIQAIFDAYASTMDSLAKAHPGTTFLYTTAALMSEESGWSGVEATQIGVPSTAGDSDNARREQYNALVRQRFGSTGRLFDLAQLESELPDGTIAAKTVDGVPTRVMNPAFTDDSLHLNSTGAQHLATAMLGLLGRVALEHAGASPR